MTQRDFFPPPSAASDTLLTATQVLRRGACQLASLRAASAGMVFGPTIDDRAAMLERAREELLQIEHAELIYAQLTGESLLSAAERILDKLPAPKCWLEASLARLLVCLSTRVELELACDSAACDESALACEVEHVNAAHAALRDLRETSSREVDVPTAFADKWLDIALQALPNEPARTHYLTALQRDFGVSRSSATAS
jgi:hypothetical protein